MTNDDLLTRQIEILCTQQTNEVELHNICNPNCYCNFNVFIFICNGLLGNIKFDQFICLSLFLIPSSTVIESSGIKSEIQKLLPCIEL